MHTLTMKRTLAVLAVIMLFAAGCSSESEPDSGSGDGTDTTTTTTTTQTDGGDTTTTSQPEVSEPTSIRYLTFSAAPDHVDTLDAIVAGFEAENPDVTVEVETAPFDEYFTLLQTQVAGGDAPDAFELNFENFVSYASRGVLADMSDLIAADADFDAGAYYQPAFDAFAYDGTQYALPESYSTVVLIYNKDIFDAAGIDYPTSDWVWDDEASTAAEIAAAGDNQWGFFAGLHYWEFYKTAAQNGCGIFDDAGAVTINEAGCVEALEYMIDMVDSGSQPTAAEMGGVSDGDMFLNGELGMITTGIWMFSAFEAADFAWDIVVEPGNVQGGSHFFANGVAVSEASDKQDAAFRWLSYLTSSPEAAKLRVDASWELPTLTDDALYASYLAQTPPDNRQAVIDSLENVVVPPVIERQAELQDLVNLQIERAVAGEVTAQEALDEAAAGIAELIE